MWKMCKIKLDSLKEVLSVLHVYVTNLFLTFNLSTPSLYCPHDVFHEGYILEAICIFKHILLIYIMLIFSEITLDEWQKR